MHLRGTRTESELRDELTSSHDNLFNSNQKPGLATSLRQIFPGMKTAYILNWIPEQSEDTYLVLVDNSILFNIEIERNSGLVLSEQVVDIESYEIGLSQSRKLKLAIARDLSASDLK